MSNTLVQKNAPDFKTKGVLNGEIKEFSLSDFKGKWLVFYFYPLDFTFVCPTEIIAFNEKLLKFKELGAEILACSVDSAYTHLAWINTPRKEGGLGEIKYPILSDLTREIARNYGVLIEEAGITLRGLFIIDPKGKVRSSIINDLGIGRNIDEILRTLAAIQTVDKTGEVCPANWKPGDDTMQPTTKDSKKYFSKHF